jgi:hypothetical protein
MSVTGTGSTPSFSGSGTGTIKAGTYGSLTVGGGTVTIVADPASTPAESYPTLYFNGAGINVSATLTDSGSGSAVILHPTAGNCSGMLTVSGTGSQLSLTGPNDPAFATVYLYVEGPSTAPADSICGAAGSTSEVSFSTHALPTMAGLLYAPDDNATLSSGASPGSVGSILVYTFSANGNGGGGPIGLDYKKISTSDEYLAE